LPSIGHILKQQKIINNLLSVAVRPLQLQVQNQQAVMQNGTDTIERKAGIQPNATQGLMGNTSTLSNSNSLHVSTTTLG